MVSTRTGRLAASVHRIVVQHARERGRVDTEHGASADLWERTQFGDP